MSKSLIHDECGAPSEPPETPDEPQWAPEPNRAGNYEVTYTCSECGEQRRLVVGVGKRTWAPDGYHWERDDE